MAVPGTTNNNNTELLKNKHDAIIDEGDRETTSLEVLGDNVDAFDEAIYKERERTQKARLAAKYNRDKYANAMEVISQKEGKIEELYEILERKNKQISQAQRLDRYARDNQVVATDQQRNFSS
jgi:hypothetical protein